MTRDHASPAAMGVTVALALMPAFWPSGANAAPEERDEICQGYRGTALWGQCTRAVVNGCHESEQAHRRCEQWAELWREQTGDADPPWLIAATSCVCDELAGQTGTTGAEILATLCPARSLAEFVTFEDSDDVNRTSVYSAVLGALYDASESNPFTIGPTRSLSDVTDITEFVSYAITVDEVEDCRTHLRVSCGQQPVP